MKEMFSFVVALCLMAFIPAGAKEAGVSLTNLTVEGRERLFGSDEMHPRFGWQIQSDNSDVMQTSYRILVASSKEMLEGERADIWDSGTILSDSSQWIEYGGIPLKPNCQYFWKAVVSTNKGSADAEGMWAMGLLSDSNWKGTWIGFDGLAPGESLARHGVLAPRYMRHEFNAIKKVRRAVLHISGLGNYTAYINGQRVGEDVLTPLPTDYAKRVAYDSYDVTRLIGKRNAIGVIVAGGNFTGMVQNFQTNVRTSYGLPRLKANLVMEYADGSAETVCTDGSWKLSTEGPIRNAAGYDGELWDANFNLGKWTSPGYNDRRWGNADIMDSPSGSMRGAIAPNMHVYTLESPVSLKKVGGRHIVDFGANGAGRVRLNVKVAKGDTVRIRHAELLNGNGDGLYTDNLRQAYATATFVSDGHPALFSPEFTYYGFRYVEVTGVDNLEVADISRELIADRMDDADTYIVFNDRSGNDMLGRILGNARRGIRSNYKGMPVDCPQRDERMPWLGDRTTGCYGESYLADVHALYSKWVRDICDSQHSDGSISDVSPAYWRLYNNNITWPAALPMACDMLYRQYGDLRPFRECYPNVKKFLLLVRGTKYSDGLVTYDRYGDWCVPPESPELVHSKDSDRMTDGMLIATAYYVHLCRLMEKYARLLGMGDVDAAYFSKEAEASQKALNVKFLSGGNYSNATVTANLLPLAMGLAPADSAGIVTHNLISRIVEKDACHISSGVIGIQWLMRWLSDSGHGDIAYSIATNGDYPGWGYMVNKGATTIWELWNGDTANPSMNSCNHVMLLGDLLIWCYEYLGGIRPDPENPGFKHIIYSPDYSVDALAGVEASHPSPYGLISAKWERTDGVYTISVTIPHNTTAEIHLPDGGVRHVGSGSNTFSVDVHEQQIHQIRNSDALQNPIAVISQSPGLSSIFHSWGFIGDSLSSGELEYHKPDGSKGYLDLYEYSWGQRICQVTGAVGENYSQGGETTRGWIQHFWNRPKNNNGNVDAKLSPKQAYIIALGVNDENRKIPVGDVSDIDLHDYNNNEDTFTGNYAGIIQRLKSIQPEAKFFVVTMPRDIRNHEKYNEAIRKIARTFDNTYLIDLFKYAPSYVNSELRDKMFMGGHLTAAGYQYTAWMMMTYIDWIIRNNIKDFQQVPFIGTQYKF